MCDFMPICDSLSIKSDFHVPGTFSASFGSLFELTSNQMAKGLLVMKWSVMDLSEAEKAHRMLEGRQTTGKLLLSCRVASDPRL